MVDKLYKNHHKGMYYRVRNFSLAIIATLSVGAAIGIPTYIAIDEQNKTSLLAEEETPEDKTEQVDTSLTYND